MSERYIQVTTSDMDDDVYDGFNTWYDTKHIPDVLSAPGLLGAHRFEAVDGEPRFLTMYSLESLESWGTPEFWEAAGARPFERPFRTIHGSIYRHVFSAGESLWLPGDAAS